MNSIFYFQDTGLIRNAIAMAEANPEQISQGVDIHHFSNSDEVELLAETFVVGRHAILSEEVFGKSISIRCKTFLSLGKIELDTLKIFADNIILVGKVNSGDTAFEAKETIASVGCSITGPGNLKIKADRILMSAPILNHTIKTVQEKINIQRNDGTFEEYVIGTKRVEWHEDPTDASIRDIKKELQMKETYDLYLATSAVRNAMGLTSILV